jgi:hypothetical protein
VKAAETLELEEQAQLDKQVQLEKAHPARAFDAPEPGSRIVAPFGELPARVYRLRVPFEIPTGGSGEAIEIDADETTLAATFAQLTYDALDPPDDALEAGLATQGDARVVMLDGPRRVHRVRLTSGAEVSLYRMDGDKRVDDESVSGLSGVALDEFTDRRFAVRPSNVEAVVVRSYATAPRVGIAARGAAEATFFWRAEGEIGKPSPAGDPAASPPPSAGIVTDGAGLAKELQRLVDALPQPLPPQIELDLVFESDAPCRVKGVSFQVDYRVVTRSFGSPSYGRGDLKDAAALARALREERDPVSRRVHELLTAAGRKLVESAAPDEGALVAELNALVGGPSVYEAEAFAEVELPQATRAAAETGATGALLAPLNRTLLDAAYPDELAAPGEKRVLRFAGNRAELRELTIRLPAGATVVEATLETIESIGADRPAGGGATDGPEANTGVRVDPDTVVAARTELDATMAATGLGFLLVPTTEQAELLAELREDHAGTPKGRKLAETALAVEGLGGRTWATARFAAPIALQAQAHWVVLAARSGTAVWLAEPAAGDVQVLERSDEEPRDAIRSVAPIHRILSRSAELAAAPAVAVTVAGEPTTTTAEGETRKYDLAAALNAYLGNQSGSGSVTIPLTIATASSGNITVNPPHVVYDLA